MTARINSGGATIVTEPVTTKRVEVVSATETYIGDAPPGTAESADGWAIKYLTSDIAGNLTGVYIGSGAWDDRASLTYE